MQKDKGSKSESERLEGDKNRCAEHLLKRKSFKLIYVDWSAFDNCPLNSDKSFRFLSNTRHPQIGINLGFHSLQSIKLLYTILRPFLNSFLH